MMAGTLPAEIVRRSVDLMAVQSYLSAILRRRVRVIYLGPASRVDFDSLGRVDPCYMLHHEGKRFLVVDRGEVVLLAFYRYETKED